MQFKDITTWSVSKGVATPVNPYSYNSDIEYMRSLDYKSNYDAFEEFAAAHTYTTDAPDGSYSADCFVGVVTQYFWNNEWVIPIGDHTGLKYITIKSRQFLPFIDNVKEAESPKFGEWISVKDRLPENRNWCLVMCNKELFLSNYKHGIFETEKPLILHGVTHWMPLPSPPKTL